MLQEHSVAMYEEEHQAQDGQIPVHESILRRASTIGDLEKQPSSVSGFPRLQSQAQSIVSRIRSREPGQTARFSHPLTREKTSSDSLVTFDGDDDPYRPMNWNFKKKVVTTVLYGLTTMGKLGHSFESDELRVFLLNLRPSRDYTCQCHVRYIFFFRSHFPYIRVCNDLVQC